MCRFNNVLHVRARMHVRARIHADKRCGTQLEADDKWRESLLALRGLAEPCCGADVDARPDMQHIVESLARP